MLQERASRKNENYFSFLYAATNQSLTTYGFIPLHLFLGYQPNRVWFEVAALLAKYGLLRTSLIYNSASGIFSSDLKIILWYLHPEPILASQQSSAATATSVFYHIQSKSTVHRTVHNELKTNPFKDARLIIVLAYNATQVTEPAPKLLITSVIRNLNF